MPAEFDKKILNTTVSGVVQKVFQKQFHIDLPVDPAIVERDIIEYDGRMRVFPMEKFNGPCVVSYVNFFLSTRDRDLSNTLGTFVIFVKIDIAEKFLKFFSHAAKDADDDAIICDVVGKFCTLLAQGIKDELLALGYIELTLSEAVTLKNSIPDGIPFDYSLFQKQELSFLCWNQRAIVIETCMSSVPQKG